MIVCSQLALRRIYTAVLYSTSDPTSSDIGSYQLIMTTTTTADAGIGIPITQDDIIDYYYLDIANSINN